MNNRHVALYLALILLSPGFAAERLKVKIGPEDLEYFNRNRNATLVEWHHPDYPPEPKAEWAHEVVSVAFIVDAEGRVTDPMVLSGSERFRPAALAAIQRWKFRPEMVDTRPAAVDKRVRFIFTPEGTPKKTTQDEYLPPYRPEDIEKTPPVSPGNTDPIYPPSLVNRRLAGEVEMVLGISAAGRVEGIKILRMTHPDFLGAALETVETWKMRPAKQGRLPTDGQQLAILEFLAVDEMGKERRDGWLELNGIFLRNTAETKSDNYFDVPPEAVAMVDPVYPYELAMAGTRGSARVDFSVNHRGVVVDVMVAEATAPEFGESLAAAIAAWRFQPLQRNREAIGADFSIAWRFESFREGSAEQRLLNNLGTPQQSVSARQLDRPLHPLFTRAPLYPAARLDALEAGQAEIEVTIDREGRVRFPRIRAASQPEFGWAAATAVSQWLFETPLKDGVPVDVRVVIPVDFKAP